MSEFSASFHLRTNDADEAVALLRRARVAGFVYDAAGSWTAIAHAEGSERAIVAANTGTLIAWDYGADHGCSVKAYRGKDCVAELAVDFERPKVRFDREAFVAAKLLGARASKVLERVLRGGAARSLRDAVAGAFGLTHHAWVAYRYAREAELIEEGCRHVCADGRLAEPDAVEPAIVIPPTRVRAVKPAARPALSDEMREALEACADIDALLRSRDRGAPQR